jgi:hypothetical protein
MTNDPLLVPIYKDSVECFFNPVGEREAQTMTDPSVHRSITASAAVQYHSLGNPSQSVRSRVIE